MIRINVAEIKKRLVGSKEFSYELTSDELGITEADLKITTPVVLKGMVENAGDVILLKAEAATEIERTCGRCLKVYTEKLNAQVVEKFYPAGAENIENDAFIYESDLLNRACSREPPFGSSFASTLQGRLPWAVSGLRG